MPSSSPSEHRSSARPDTPFPQNAFSASLSSNIISSGVPDISAPSKDSPRSPSSLRKSISVDSFMSTKGDVATDGQARQARFRVNADLQEPSTSSSRGSGIRVRTKTIALTDPAGSRREDSVAFPRGPSRRRGASISTAADGVSISDVSEDVHSDASAHLGEISRRASKVRAKSRLVARPGELVLPPRLPPLAADDGFTDIDYSPLGLGEDVTSRSITRKSTTSVFAGGPTGRLRSGSIGIPLSESSETPTHAASSWGSHSPWPDISIAVVGTSHCGKSTFVETGLCAYGLSNPLACSVPLGEKGAFEYTFRTGRIPRPHSGRTRILGVMEVDVPARSLDHVSNTDCPIWPGGAPDIQGVLICYDCSDEQSFQPIESLLREYRELKLPMVVVACKSDMERRVSARKGHALASSFDTGIVEVSAADEAGKEKMQRCFDWLLRAIFKDKRMSRFDLGGTYRNPASPDVLETPTFWEPPRSSNATPTPGSVAAPHMVLSTAGPQKLPRSTLSSHSPARQSPRSHTRVCSTSDLHAEEERKGIGARDKDVEDSSNRDVLEFQANMATVGAGGPAQEGPSDIGESAESLPDNRERDAPVPWATLEQLLDKLLFLAVSGDDPTFITHFLLTYRRFATPRGILLAMQKRMIQLSQTSADPMFASFAQMRICHLLERWIREYPGDFAVKGTQGAFNAVLNSILGKTYLLHYGSDFLPFRDALPTLVDRDAAWALKTNDFIEISDDSSSSHHGDDEVETEIRATSRIESASIDSFRGQAPPRERRPSLPLTAKALVAQTSSPSVNSNETDPSEMSHKQLLKELLKMVHEVNNLESAQIAQEITRMEARLFLAIKPRHWLQHVLVPGRKEPDIDPIARFSQVSSHLADWVVSLILCHDKPKARAKQIDKFVDVASHLRRMNNYSALRAFVAGINNSTFPGDETMSLFKEKSAQNHKLLQSYDVLLQSIRSHRAYRMALRNTKGPCIPALEVHISDLIRTQEGNPDFKPDDGTKIHWGKYNLMGKFISTITQCQDQCRNSTDYDFPERPNVADLILRDCIMGEEMQQARLASVSDVGGGQDDNYGAPAAKPTSRDYAQSTKDPTLIKKIFFW